MIRTICHGYLIIAISLFNVSCSSFNKNNTNYHHNIQASATGITYSIINIYSIIYVHCYDYQLSGLLLGLWLRLECSLDSLSIDSAHVIYVAEGHNVGAERQSSVMTLRKPIVTWII